MYLWVLSENIKGCFAFLETAPLENHKTSLRLRNYISSVSYTNLLGICAIAIIVNWYTSHLVQ